jgi:predicted nucleic acid-binding protein
MRAIDTNVLVRLITRDDAAQSSQADSFIERGAWASILALELFRSRPALGFTDCLLLRFARKAGHLPLGAFDRVLGKIEGTRKL